MENEKNGGKSSACSISEFVQILRRADMNGADRLFGGHLMTWMDEVAAVSARRYAEGPVTEEEKALFAEAKQRQTK